MSGGEGRVAGVSGCLAAALVSSAREDLRSETLPFGEHRCGVLNPCTRAATSPTRRIKLKLMLSRQKRAPVGPIADKFGVVLQPFFATGRPFQQVSKLDVPTPDRIFTLPATKGCFPLADESIATVVECRFAFLAFLLRHRSPRALGEARFPPETFFFLFVLHSLHA